MRTRTSPGTHSPGDARRSGLTRADARLTLVLSTDFSPVRPTPAGWARERADGVNVKVKVKRSAAAVLPTSGLL